MFLLSELKIYNAKGLFFLLINLIASSIFLKVNIGNIGPKISSLKILESLSIFSIKVGSI